jgi:hypothetical protein
MITSLRYFIASKKIAIQRDHCYHLLTKMNGGGEICVPSSQITLY